MPNYPLIIYCPNCGKENYNRYWCSLCGEMFPIRGSTEWKKLARKPKGHTLHELVA